MSTDSVPTGPRNPAIRTGWVLYGWSGAALVTPLYAMVNTANSSGFNLYVLPVIRGLGKSQTSMRLAAGLASLAAGIQGRFAGAQVQAGKLFLAVPGPRSPVRPAVFLFDAGVVRLMGVRIGH